jgi:hypothetical protein
LVTAPGDAEVTVVADETMGEEDPPLARLLEAATAGAPPAGPATRRKPVRIVLDPDDRPVTRGVLRAQAHAFSRLSVHTRKSRARSINAARSNEPGGTVLSYRA